MPTSCRRMFALKRSSTPKSRHSRRDAAVDRQNQNMELPITLPADHPLRLGNFTSAHLGTFESALTIVPGGGVALLRASEHLKGLRTKNDDQKTGVEIVRKALSAPARQIAINAGEDGSVIVGKILEKDQYSYGFDSQTGEYVNLVAKGIIDPTKVV